MSKLHLKSISLARGGARKLRVVKRESFVACCQVEFLSQPKEIGFSAKFFWSRSQPVGLGCCCYLQRRKSLPARWLPLLQRRRAKTENLPEVLQHFAPSSSVGVGLGVVVVVVSFLLQFSFFCPLWPRLLLQAANSSLVGRNYPQSEAGSRTLLAEFALPRPALQTAAATTSLS